MSIPGVPIGAKIVRVAMIESPIKPGEYSLRADGVITDRQVGQCGIVVAPDNPYGKFLHEVEADIKAAGRERLGGDDLRTPNDGEEYWGVGGSERKFLGKHEYLPRFILKPRKRRVLVVECEESELPRDPITKVGTVWVKTEHDDKLVPAKSWKFEERDL